MSAPVATHTKGPWTALHAPHRTTNIIHDARSRTVAQAYGEDRDANSRLIAAAPDLLAACVALMTSIEPNGFDPTTEPHFREPLMAARSAITRAGVE